MMLNRKRRATRTQYPVAKRKRTVPTRQQIVAHLNKIVEKKVVPFGLAPLNLLNGVVYLFNPFYFIDRGVGKDQRIGNMGSNVKLHYRFHGSPLLTNSLGAQLCEGVAIRVIVFKHNKEWNSGGAGIFAPQSAGAGAIISEGEILYDTGDDRLATAFTNNQDIVVVHDKIYKGARTIATSTATTWAGESIVGTATVNLGNIRWDGGNNTYLRTGNYYVCVTSAASSDAAGLDRMALLRMNLLVTFGDA